MVRAVVLLQVMSWYLTGQAVRPQPAGLRANHNPLLIVIPIALVVAMGLIAAWYISCRRHGLYPTLSVPAWKSAGNYRAWCS